MQLYPSPTRVKMLHKRTKQTQETADLVYRKQLTYKYALITCIYVSYTVYEQQMTRRHLPNQTIS